MPTNPRILAVLNDGIDEDILFETLAERFPAARIDRVDEEALLERVTFERYHLLLLDSEMIRSHSVARVLTRVTSCLPDLVIILLIPPQRTDLVRTAIEQDVFLYLCAPLSKTECSFALERAEAAVTYRFNADRSAASAAPSLMPGFIGGGPAMSNLFRLIERVADDDFSTVLIRGESGTGKELVAKALHFKSRRAEHNFVPVNCAAIPDDLLESELFGHLKGSFTGAAQTKTGRIQYADGGTLFLDEIGDMKPNLQAKLLRVLQEKEFEPVGSLKPIPVDTRIVAATHCDLEELVKQGTFREDLYYRLSVIPVEVPPLRERSEDIPLLLETFITTYTTKRGRKKIRFSDEAVAALKTYSWRGNVRELENLVQHMSILYGGKTITSRDLPDKFRPPAGSGAPPPQETGQAAPPSSELDISRERADLFAPLDEVERSFDLSSGPIDFNGLIHEFETELILKAMRYTSGNKKEAARMLRLKRTTLLEKIKKKGIEGMWE